MSGGTANVPGSGWGTLAWDPARERLVTQQIQDHHFDLAITSMPLLVFDV
ncbi:Fe-Mn family superoxide dismutase [Mycobacterium tilburgii]|nr:Fe-Mn family superoxide dismutase [Mycobacterium tilburgii]